MAEEQLKLFSLRNALHQRFDGAFFRALPSCAGVYLMLDGRDRIIYVGKARNLRQRIGSYRYAHEQCSRKTARLVARVAKIQWQVCDSEENALLEENRLLRELRPLFNRMNTWPKASRFIRLGCHNEAIELSLVSEPEDECYGAFKGTSRQTFSALLRLLHGLNRSYADLPRCLLLEKAPRAHGFVAGTAMPWVALLRAFLRGECDGLLQQFSAAALPEQNRFHAAFRAADLLAVEHFFRIGPQRNRTLREQFGAADLIPQEQLDDLLVRHRESQRGSASAERRH